MREILFRGKDIVGNWYAGNLAVIKQDLHNGAGTIKAGSYISNKCGVPFAYQVILETVGQFTGLTDKNGKKIFEGDIVEIEWESGIMKAYVVFWQGNFCLSGSLSPIWPNIVKNKYMVISNIHDNPELLK